MPFRWSLYGVKRKSYKIQAQLATTDLTEASELRSENEETAIVECITLTDNYHHHQPDKLTFRPT